MDVPRLVPFKQDTLVLVHLQFVHLFVEIRLCILLRPVTMEIQLIMTDVLRPAKPRLALLVPRLPTLEETVQPFVEILWFWAHRNVTMGD